MFFYKHMAKCSVNKSYIFLVNCLVTTSLTHKVTPRVHIVTLQGRNNFPTVTYTGFVVESLLCISCGGLTAVVRVEDAVPSTRLRLDLVVF